MISDEELKTWRMPNAAPIISMEKAAQNVRTYDYVDYGVTSGGYDPLHPGHLSSFNDAVDKADMLIVVVNGDGFLERKKGRAFMPLKVRCQIVSMVRWIDYVVPFEPTNPNDMTVCEALEVIRPRYFCKGGDRTNIENIPEWEVCERNGIEIVTGCGDDKIWSSSNFLNDHAQFVLERNRRG